MIFRISIDSVSGEDSFSCATYNPEFALDFLKRYDHGGSNMSLVATMEHEAAYEFLRGLIEADEEKNP